MKLTLSVLSALLVATVTSAAPQHTLGDELKEFRALISFNKINALVFKYFANDYEFQSLVKLILSDDVLPGFHEIEEIPEVKNIIEYLHNHGSDIYQLLNRLHNVLGIPPYHSKLEPLRDTTTNGLAGFVEELRLLIPIEKLQNLYDHKLKTSATFREFVEFIKSPNSQTGIDKILANQHIRNLIIFIKSKNVDLRVIADFVTALTGIKIKPVENVKFHASKPKPEKPGKPAKPGKSDFTKDIMDILALVPTPKIITLGSQYLKSSKDFRMAYIYLDSQKFQSSSKMFQKTAEAKKLMEYMKTHGFNLEKFTKTAEMKLGFNKFNASTAGKTKPLKTGNMTHFFMDVKALLPQKQIHSLTANKTATNPSFGNFTSSLQSKEFLGLYDAFFTTPKATELLSESLEYGFDIQGLVQLWYSMIGLDFKHIVHIPNPSQCHCTCA